MPESNDRFNEYEKGLCEKDLSEKPMIFFNRPVLNDAINDAAIELLRSINRKLDFLIKSDSNIIYIPTKEEIRKYTKVRDKNGCV